MNRSTLGTAAVLLFAAALSANAQPSYSYVQAAYLVSQTATSLGDQSGDGPELRFSYELLPYLHVFAGYRSIQLDDLPLETKTSEAGVGFNVDVSDRQSVFFNLSVLSTDVEVSAAAGTTLSDDGYAYSIGYRETNDTRLEFEVSADHFELDKSDYADTSLRMSLQYEVKPRFKVEGGVSFLGDDTYWKAGVRYYLPGRSGRRAR